MNQENSEKKPRVGIGPNVHELKCWPEYFDALAEGKKTFEIRRNDRGFQAQDILLLRELDPASREYTGRMVMARVTYITDFEQQPGYVVMALQFIN